MAEGVLVYGKHDVCTMLPDNGRTSRVKEANARLIAAAPEMFEALDHISGLCRALRSGGPDPMDLQELSDALHEAVDMANAAISRATGEGE